MFSILLHLHSQQGSDLDCLKGLITFGANTDSVNAFGQTTLDLAKMGFSGEYEAIEWHC